MLVLLHATSPLVHALAGPHHASTGTGELHAIKHVTVMANTNAQITLHMATVPHNVLPGTGENPATSLAHAIKG